MHRGHGLVTSKVAGGKKKRSILEAHLRMVVAYPFCSGWRREYNVISRSGSRTLWLMCGENNIMLIILYLALFAEVLVKNVFAEKRRSFYSFLISPPLSLAPHMYI